MGGAKGETGVGTAMVKLGKERTECEGRVQERGRKRTILARVFAQDRCWFGSDSFTVSGTQRSFFLNLPTT